MPARKKPVIKRSKRILAKVFPSHITSALNKEPSKAQLKNTFDGEKRSAIVKMAKIRVPSINPNCTADVKWPKALLLRLKTTIRSLITPFPANQSEMQQN
jgi:hypothetical protein